MELETVQSCEIVGIPPNTSPKLATAMSGIRLIKLLQSSFVDLASSYLKTLALQFATGIRSSAKLSL